MYNLILGATLFATRVYLAGNDWTSGPPSGNAGLLRKKAIPLAATFQYEGLFLILFLLKSVRPTFCYKMLPNWMWIWLNFFANYMFYKTCQVIVSDQSATCSDACTSRGLVCEPSFFLEINNKASFENHLIKCERFLIPKGNEVDSAYPAHKESL